MAKKEKKHKNKNKNKPKFVPSTTKVEIPITQKGQIKLQQLRLMTEICKTCRIPLGIMSLMAFLYLANSLPQETFEKVGVFFKIPTFILLIINTVFFFALVILKKITEKLTDSLSEKLKDTTSANEEDEEV